METLNKHTEIELLKLINDSKIKHENIKKEIINLTYELDEIDKNLNKKLDELQFIEKTYILLIEELNNQ
jgi:hypothetical protein